jgi:DNA-binding MarR family transcriptional regulator
MIEQAISQRIQFSTEQVRLTVSVMFASSVLHTATNSALKVYGISIQQFNVLRILRGMHPKAATIKLITERMVDKMSNASRLIDKLEKRGLVMRTEDGKDRRKVEVTITQLGLDLLVEASVTLETHITHFMEQKLSMQETKSLNLMLEKIIK